MYSYSNKIRFIGIILIQGLRWFLMELRLLFSSMHSQAGAWERGKAPAWECKTVARGLPS
jgi:hypothetical protein